MIYEYLFVFFDSVSTGRFIVWFLLLYFSLHALVHRALLRHGRFRAADYGKQSAILVNVLEAALLAFIRLDSPNTKGFHLEKIREAPSLHIMFSMFGLTALWHGDISLLDTTQHAPNPQVMVSMSTCQHCTNMSTCQVLINMATMYVGKDLANLLLNKRIAATTVVHHVCVFMAYGYVLRSGQGQ